ncbi:unnamed protein product [Rotaria sordida]|uniref:Cullin-1 n=2 Tax=Rotaria sordida TaxID=392033 RepID=A0A819FPM5_9BILA|nr:unnamed protein product [Rotaria sordida]CAF3894517.1 unnamed protein product [Rotaria sordida]
MTHTVDNFNFNDTWIKISEGLEHIYHSTEMSLNAYCEIMVYNCCTHARLQRNSLGRERISTRNNRQNNLHDRDNAADAELYTKLKDYLKNYLKEIREKGLALEGDSLLRFYVTNWEHYRFSSKVTNGFCHYLNRHCIRQLYDSGRRDVYEIFTMALEVWLLVFFQTFQSQVTLACLQLIDVERQSEIINTQLIRTVVQSYIELALCENPLLPNNSDQITSSRLQIYKDYFEVPFLQHTKQFYRQKATDFLRHNSISEYFKKVQQWIDEELYRVQSYLHDSTSVPLTEILKQVFIHDQLEAIYTEAKTLLHDEKYSDFICLFKSVNHITHATVQLKKIFEENFCPKGIESMGRISTTAIDDPKLYVETILDIHKEFFQVAQKVFDNDEYFIAFVDKACGNFINHNAVTVAVDNARKSAELLARYCDILLRKGNKIKIGIDIEEKFNQIMIVFNYIKDKDVFEKFYSKMLAKRLIGKLSASKDYEESMILRLKHVCGFAYASTLQKMFQDVSVSEKLLDEYRKYSTKENIVDFSVMVVSSNSWPFFALPNFIIPTELKQTFESFTKFYIQQHNERKLTWLHQHSNGELQIFYTDKKYILRVSIYQMAVLLLFNKLSSYTVEQMQDKTQIKIDFFLQVLYSLLKSKLLTCSEITDNKIDEDYNKNDIKMNYTIRINENFCSKNIRLNLNVPCKSVEQRDIENLHRTIDGDRQIIIQAAIVRIMKARQTLKSALLEQEVIQQLSKSFESIIPSIKKCIDILIEKEYIERQPNEQDTLRYLR